VTLKSLIHELARSLSSPHTQTHNVLPHAHAVQCTYIARGICFLIIATTLLLCMCVCTIKRYRESRHAPEGDFFFGVASLFTSLEVLRVEVGFHREWRRFFLCMQRQHGVARFHDALRTLPAVVVKVRLYVKSTWREGGR